MCGTGPACPDVAPTCILHDVLFAAWGLGLSGSGCWSGPVWRLGLGGGGEEGGGGRSCYVIGLGCTETGITIQPKYVLLVQVLTPVRRSARKLAAAAAAEPGSRSLSVLLEATNYSYTPNTAMVGAAAGDVDADLDCLTSGKKLNFD